MNGQLAALPVGIVDMATPRKDVAAALWNARAVVSGKNIVIKVTGALLQDVGWYLDGSVMAFSNYGYGGAV